MSVDDTVNVPVAICVTVGLAIVPNVSVELAYEAVQLTVVIDDAANATDNVAVVPAKSYELAVSILCPNPTAVFPVAPVIW